MCCTVLCWSDPNSPDKQFNSLKCVAAGPYGGQVCPFPNMKVSVVKLNTIKVSAPETPSGGSSITSQFSETRGSSVASFRRAWSNAAPSNSKSPDFLLNKFVDWGNDKALGGIQGKIAKQGQKTIKSVLLQMAEQIYGGLNQALVNPELASQMLEMDALKDSIHEGVVQSLPDLPKVGYLVLTNRYDEAMKTLKKWSKERAGNFAWDYYKNKGSSVAKGFMGGAESNSGAYGSSGGSISDIGPHPDASRWILRN